MPANVRPTAIGVAAGRPEREGDTVDAKQMKILIALDASPQSEAAVNYLSRLAAADRTEVLLFHVFKKHPARYWDLDHGSDEKPEAAPMEEWERVHRAGVEAFLDRSRRVFLGRGFPAEAVRVEVRDRQKGVAADITAEVRKGCDLAVVGRWGHSEAEELIFGSVAHRLMAKLTGEALGSYRRRSGPIRYLDRPRRV